MIAAEEQLSLPLTRTEYVPIGNPVAIESV